MIGRTFPPHRGVGTSQQGGEHMNLNASDIIRLVSSIMELVASAIDKSDKD